MNDTDKKNVAIGVIAFSMATIGFFIPVFSMMDFIGCMLIAETITGIHLGADLWTF